MAFTVVIGIPSYNEVETIGTVTRDLDEAAQVLSFAHRVIIVNADNCSSDGTPEEFSRTETRCEKLLLSTPGPGKGANVRAMMEYAVQEGSDALLVVDADLSFVRRSWVHGLLEPLTLGFDAAFARRPPLWNRGDLTYHLCYPLIAGIFGADIREPISPTVAISQSVMRRALDSPWDPAIYQYGIDLFLTSIAVEMNWCEVLLAEKLEHKLRSYNPKVILEGTQVGRPITNGGKYREVLEAIRHRVLRRIKQPMPGAIRVSSIGISDFRYSPVEWDAEHEALSNAVAANLSTIDFQSILPGSTADQICGLLDLTSAFPGFPWPLWQEVLFEWLKRSATQREPAATTEQMELFLLGRVVGFYREHLHGGDWDSTVKKQAISLFDARRRLWD